MIDTQRIETLEKKVADLEKQIQSQLQENKILKMDKSNIISEDLVNTCKQYGMYSSQLLTGRPLPEGLLTQK